MAYDEPERALSVVDFMFLKVVTNLVYMGSEEKVAKNVRPSSFKRSEKIKIFFRQTGDLLLAISKLKLPGASLVGLGKLYQIWKCTLWH